jgi:hypothetical protein
MIKGLLTQKADTPAPIVGQTRPYAWSEVTGRSGKAYTKIKFDGQQGQPCKIISAQKNDWSDQYGNVSYSVELEPSFAKSPEGKPDQANGVSKDSWRQHLMRSANLLAKCHAAAKAVGLEDGEDARCIFIDASRAGYIAAMPPKPMTDPEPEAMPESDEPRPEDTSSEF